MSRHNPPRARKQPDLIEWVDPDEVQEKKDSAGAVFVSTVCMLLLGAGLLGVAGGILYLMVDTAQVLGSGRSGARTGVRFGRLALLWIIVMLVTGAGGGWLTLFGLKTMFQLVRGDWRKKSRRN